MGIFEDAKAKAGELLGQHSDKVEEISDQGLDKADEFAKEKTGGQFDAQIDQARDAADQQVGSEEGGII